MVLIGPIRQELLSGIRFEEQFVKLQDQLRAFPEMLLRAARYSTGVGLAVSKDHTPTF